MAYNYYLSHKFAYQLLCRFTIEFFVIWEILKIH